MNDVAILFGAVSDPISKQLADQFFAARDSDIEWWQRDVHLGCFKTAEEASAAYLKAKRELHPYSTI